MAEIDFTTMEFNEAVATAMKEFGLDEQDATEFINLIHGKGPDIMTEKAKKSLPKGTFTKIRKEVAGKASNPDALAGWIKNRMKKDVMKPPMMKKKEITTKAGTSEGVKKGWLSRRRGSVGKKIVGAATFGPRAYVGAAKKTAGAAKKIAGFGARTAGAGARAYARGVKKSIPFKVAKKVGGAYAAAGKKTFGVGKKIASTGARAYAGGVKRSIPFKVAKKVGSAYVGAGKKTLRFVRKKEITTKAGNSESVRRAWISRKRGKFNGQFNRAVDTARAFQQSKAGKVLGTAAKVAAVAGVIGLGVAAARSKRGNAFITNRVIGRGTSPGGVKWHETASFGHLMGRGVKAGIGAAKHISTNRKRTYEYGGKLRSGPTYHSAISPRIRHYGTKETSLMARVDNIRSEVSKAAGEDYFVADIYDGYAILSEWKNNSYFKAPYMETKDGVTLADKGQWTEVEKSWEEVESKEISELTITKDANDKWRWTLFPTNSFEDRDGEVISKKGLETDLEISELEFKDKGNYGPLRWWHVVTGDDPVKDGLEIGTCDFRGMEDRVMIESGTFLNEELGEALAPHAKELGGSIGFKHSTSEPDSDKVFHSIRIFERSLLPLERASNPLATLIIQKEGGIMQKEKIDKLTELLGGKEKAEKILGTAKETQDKADAAGIRNKEAQVVETKDEGQVPDASEELTQEEWEGFVEAVGEALGELLPEDEGDPDGDVENKEVNELKQTLKELGENDEKIVGVLDKLDARLKELEGGQPASKPHVASESKDTISKKNHSEPAPDPLNSFMDSFVLKK